MDLTRRNYLRTAADVSVALDVSRNIDSTAVMAVGPAAAAAIRSALPAATKPHPWRR